MLETLRTLRNYCQELALVCQFYRAGKLEAYRARCADMLDGDLDYFYCNLWDIFDAVCDFVVVKARDDDWNETTLYFSDAIIRTYFQLCRRHAAMTHTRLRRDAFIRRAHDFIYRTLLDACPYYCLFQITHKRHAFGSGIAVSYAAEFDQQLELVSAMLEILQYLQCETVCLQSALDENNDEREAVS